MSTSAVILPPASALGPPGDRAARLLRSFFGSGVFVAACAAALAYETNLIANVAPQPARFYAFLFFATWASYRTHSLRPRRGLPRATLATTWAIFLAVAALGLTLPRAMRPAIALLALFAWAYSRPTLPGVRRLREFGLAKVFVLTGVWTIATTYLPLVDRPITGGPLALLLLRRLLFMFTLCVAFDVRDRLDDAAVGIRTLPVRLGPGRSYALMRGTLVAFVALVCFGPAVSSVGSAGPVEVALVLSAIATWIAVELSRGGRSTWFYLGFIDGMMLLQALLVWAMLWTMRG